MPKQTVVSIKRRQQLRSKSNLQAAKEAEVAVLFLRDWWRFMAHIRNLSQISYRQCWIRSLRRSCCYEFQYLYFLRTSGMTWPKISTTFWNLFVLLFWRRVLQCNELTTSPKLALNFWHICLSLVSAGMTGICHHARLEASLKELETSWFEISEYIWAKHTEL